ncbi:replication terminator protein [Anaerobacillus sp. CMMVII]|uniref:replication terminator protein n=1 Tax=Anaerobacillus sp. CMMVII TaxID=2755588 RepID=UPI0021B7657A|nr:replication terminator protein [Anaerobacillus sp. CMMVII]
MSNILDLNNLADGAVAERFNQELRKILENISDPNTDAKKVRKLTLTVSFKADDQRDIAAVGVQAKTTLAPARDIETKIVLDWDSNGQITGAELKSGIKGQTYMQEDGVYSDTGEKVYDFRAKKAEGK